MKTYVYPAVFYYDSEADVYCAAIDDIALFIEGDTVEEAHKNIKSALEVYVSTSLRYDEDLPSPSSFNELISRNPKEIVMLVEVKV